VIFTALLDAHDPPASIVTDELGLADADADADADEVAATLLDAAGAVVELLPPLHAARPVTAARAATPLTASRVRRLRECLDCGEVSDVIGLIGGNSFVFAEPLRLS
jgi:hypothetical protein